MNQSNDLLYGVSVANSISAQLDSIPVSRAAV